MIEKNEKLGKKLFITGKGRCNVTNACEVEKIFDNVLEHSKFLYSAIYGFDNRAVMDLFETIGCPLKTERGQRVFPRSDHSSDIIRALERELKRCGVSVLLDTEVKKIHVEPLEDEKEDLADAGLGGPRRRKKQALKKKQIARVVSAAIYDKKSQKATTVRADRLIVATGGLTYASTGSTGDGYRFAMDCGHSIVPLSPSLVPFLVREDWCRALQGLSLKNVRVRLDMGGSTIYSELGEMLFTHYGVSGPLILSASSYYVHAIGKGPKSQEQAKLFIDLKPALSYEQLDKRILREFDQYKNKQFRNAIGSLFPSKLVPVMPVLSGIDPDKKVHEITKEERERFIRTIKQMELTVIGIRDCDEAVITKGGVAIGEISPSSMESKLVKGLYFAGEVLDVDALTGGFNLQIAWSTGYLAGSSAAAGLADE